ncbi:autoinducer binding domain-containing protein [Paracoccus sp. 1_MG-2023]|uniref:autoinducer binding domain-containing protein n=1 Tax=unclassified Paracoccus (in: a-proteobacteria) TaxID=2688777 RepID=UPI001C08B8ED|nr:MULTISPECIES: autoinducer binding domain-containing protein [unclassified Paracoccus (in: a-proteobacteria)]MBU2957075.1 autoinducer binding domain-containing protein [Paracoccus sp. C2R09]MDO6669591.1 autoinducer binding domain-containing protein [Paracoccus sp. 1_MG-2023]
MSELQTIENRLSILAPRGYMCGYHIRFSRPVRRVTTYATEWIETYTRRNMVLADPGTIWAMLNDGALRWSIIERHCADPMGVMEAARRHGAAFGVSIGVGSPESRTICGLSHGSREFTDDEIAEMLELIRRGHEVVGRALHLRPILIEALDTIACGMTYDQACAHLGISRTALRYRLAAAREALDAPDNTQAVLRAIDAGLLSSNSPEGIARGLPLPPPPRD